MKYIPQITNVVTYVIILICAAVIGWFLGGLLWSNLKPHKYFYHVETNTFEVAMRQKAVSQIETKGFSVAWCNEFFGGRFLLPIGTNSAEIGLRTDGVVVWRTNK